MMPAAAPVSFPYAARYRTGGVHKGVDLGTPHGTVLVAPVSGTVWYAGTGGGWGPAYGGQVIIATDDLGPRRWVQLAHLSAVEVRTGQAVTAGQRIGRSGGTPGTTGAGNSTGPHVHVQMNRSTRWDDHVDPTPALNHQPAGGTRPLANTEEEDDMKGIIYMAEGYAGHGIYEGPAGGFVKLANAEERKNLTKAGMPVVWLTGTTLDEYIKDSRKR